MTRQSQQGVKKLKGPRVLAGEEAEVPGGSLAWAVG